MNWQWWKEVAVCGLAFWGVYLALPGSVAHMQVVAPCWLAGTGAATLWRHLRRRGAGR